MKKYTREMLLRMDAVDVYKLVLRGDMVKKFPDGFWRSSEGKHNAIKCTRYLIEEILKFDDDMIKEKYSLSLLKKNKLSGMLQYIYNSSPYEAINSAYPKRFKEWEFKNSPIGFWDDKENGIKATKWLIEEKLKLNDKELKEQLSINLFKKNGLSGMLETCFSGSPYEAINTIYPNKYKEWEFKSTPNGFWNNKENGMNATKWLIEEKLKLNDEEIKAKLSANLFKENGLRGMLNYCFNSSPYEAINSIYPERFKEWEFNQVPVGFWTNKENGIKATKWLIEEKLKLSDKELKKLLCFKLFKDNNLGGMLQEAFNSSPYEAINNAYPNKFKEWEFKNIPNKYWTNKENGMKAARWLVEEKLKLSDKELKELLSVNLFIENGLGGMLQYCFNSSPYKSINSVYPERFKEWEFKYVPMGFWDNKENGIKAVKWLVEEKLKLSDEELKELLSVNLFVENGLGGMLHYCFNGSPYKAINNVYSQKFKEWEFKNTPNGFWNDKENGIKATKWLLEEKLELSDDEIKERLSQKLFIENGLRGMLSYCFNNSPYEAINSAYPNKFKKSDFKGYN